MTDTETPKRLADWLEQAWLARYLDRQLSEAEEEWFEAYVLDKPQLVAALDADSDLRDGMVLVVARTGSARAVDAKPSDAAPPGVQSSEPDSVVPLSPSRRSTRPPWLAWAMAASVSLGVGWLLGQAGRESMPDVMGSPTRIFYDVTRSESAEPIVFQGSPDSPWVLLEVGLGGVDRRAELWVAGVLANVSPASEEGVASFLFDFEALASAETVSIRVLDANGVVASEFAPAPTTWRKSE